VKLGDAFLLNTVTSDDHVWFVAYQSDSAIVIFNFTSWSINKDHSCVVKPQEYSELKHASTVEYRHGELVEGDSIKILEEYGIRKFVAPVPAPTLVKIAEGAIRSDFTAQKIKRLFST